MALYHGTLSDDCRRSNPIGDHQFGSGSADSGLPEYPIYSELQRPSELPCSSGYFDDPGRGRTDRWRKRFAAFSGQRRYPGASTKKRRQIRSDRDVAGRLAGVDRQRQVAQPHSQMTATAGRCGSRYWVLEIDDVVVGSRHSRAQTGARPSSSVSALPFFGSQSEAI